MKKIIFLISALLITNAAAAQDITISAHVNKNKVTLGETITLTVSVSGKSRNIPNPVIPPMPDMSISSSGRSQSISFVNGKVSSSITFQYVIMPKTPGKHTIKPISVTIGGNVHETLPILIEVVKSQAPASAAPGKSSPRVTKEQLSNTDASKDVFVKASINKKNVYVGEMVTYTFKFYRRIRLIGDAQYVAPNLVGFLKEDLPPQKNYYIKDNNSRYMVSEIKTAIFPTSAGTATVQSASLQVTVPSTSRDPFANDDFFGSFFGGRGKKKILKTKALTLKVQSFPKKNKPADFKGAVGHFSIKSSVDTKSIKVGDPITWSITVSGEGNIKSITEPVWGDMTGFKKYDTVSSLNSNVENYRIKGSKVFQIVVVPEVSGEQIIPPVLFSYFDTKKRAYQTIKTNSLSIQVTPGESKGFSAAASPQGTGIKMLDQDIRYIKTSGMRRISSAKPYVLRAGYWAGWIVLFLMVIGSWVFELYRMKITLDIGWARSRAAHRSVRNRLSQAKRFLKKGEDKYLYSAISDAITGFLADKMNISAAGLTIREIIEKLSARALDEQMIQRIKNVLEQCDFGRFTSSSVSLEDKKKLYDETEEIIVWLIKIFKK